VEADSVSFCLSKGLAAPIGSVVCGTQDFINQARRARKLIGGGMRQAGIMAAAGIVALNEMVERLADDHANAKKLAEGLANIPGISVDPEHIKTNIVFIEITCSDMTAEELVNLLNEKGVRISASGPQRLRAVTHYHISSDDIDYTLSAFAKILK
jgi:threonine aldolase